MCCRFWLITLYTSVPFMGWKLGRFGKLCVDFQQRVTSEMGKDGIWYCYRPTAKDYIPLQEHKLMQSILLKSLSKLHKRSVTLSLQLWLFRVLLDVQLVLNQIVSSVNGTCLERQWDFSIKLCTLFLNKIRDVLQFEGDFSTIPYTRTSTVKTTLSIFRTILMSTNWPEPILENHTRDSHSLFSNQVIINKALLIKRLSSINIMIFAKLGILSENAFLVLLLVCHFILLPNSLCWLQVLVIYFPFCIVFPHFLPFNNIK